MKKFFLKYGIGLFLILVCILQLYFVKTQKLSPWKGGGFGMYSGLHYNHYEIWIRPSEAKDWINLDSIKNIPNSIFVLKNQVLRRPYTKHLEQLSSALCIFQKYNSIEMEIWKPDIYTPDSVFKKQKVAYLKSASIEN